VEHRRWQDCDWEPENQKKGLAKKKKGNPRKTKPQGEIERRNNKQGNNKRKGKAFIARKHQGKTKE